MAKVHQPTIERVRHVQLAAQLIARTGVNSWGAKPTTEQAFMEAVLSNVCEGLPFDVSTMYQVIVEQQPSHFGDMQGCMDHWCHATEGTIAAIDHSRINPFPPDDPAAWLEQLRTWHRQILGHRPELCPGEWKSKTVVIMDQGVALPTVPNDSVTSTLRAGHTLLAAEPNGWVRGCMCEYLVTAVHPFHDGNGRVSRIAGNQHTERRRILKAVHFPRYIDGLNDIRKSATADTWVRVLAQEQRQSQHMDGHTLPWVIRRWARAEWIEDHWQYADEPNYDVYDFRNYRGGSGPIEPLLGW